MVYTADDLRQMFQQPFNADAWTGVLRDYFHATALRAQPEPVEATADHGAGYYLGSLDTTDNYRVGFFRYRITQGRVARRRVSLRALVRQFVNPAWGEFDAALVVYDDGHRWRLSLVSDIRGEATSPRRYTFVFGDKESYYNTPVGRFLKLQADGLSFASLREAFSVEALSKDFYNDLFKWYEWALSLEMNVTFPNNPDTVSDDRENINIKLIRLITRLLFVWFIKQKHLVPDKLFDVDFLKSILKGFSAQSSGDGSFYNAILQNLFFATLNCAIIDEEGKPRRFADASARDTRNLYRYDEMFSIGRSDVLAIFAQVPFLNGGLFECLDKPKGLYLNLDHDILFDGFSRNASRASNGNFKYRAFVPNILFFNDDEKHLGLINLLRRYNFTIEENKPDDAEVSLDPELLGRVFENLLAAYNPETQESARNATGSFYTPRAIVEYMVDEALKSYILKAGIEGVNAENIEALFVDDSGGGIPPFTPRQRQEMALALKRVKILDPACGSGAFPMGCLLRIVSLAERLMPDGSDKYALKLDIIENCVFGVDIQPIAMLICKLRFFISLICEQENIDFSSPETNFGINTLPNLETKFVAANTLLSADIRHYDDDWSRDQQLLRMKNDLLGVRKEHFGAKGRKSKREEERQDERSRDAIQVYILKTAGQPDRKKIKWHEQEIERLKAESVKYEEEIWVDTEQPVEYDLFGVVQNSGTIFREDVNKKKRDQIKAQLAAALRGLKQERAKGEAMEFEAAVKQITEWNPYDQNSVAPFFDPEWMFCIDGKFDIVIGNPPYISTKGVTYVDKKQYENEFGFSDDTYNLFTFKGLSLCKEGGSLSFITPKTFWTTQTKRNMRDLLLSNTIEYVFDTANPFEAAMVDTCITQTTKAAMPPDHKVRFLDGTEDLQHPVAFSPIPQQIYLNTQNAVIFKPTSLNLRIYELYGGKVKELYGKWWDKIKTSRDIENNKKELEAYRASLKPGDVALLGCLTEGGQGLATANNGKYIAVRRSTKWAEKIMESRPKKLAEARKKKNVEVPEMEGYSNERDFLQSLSEKEIASLFDRLKEKYGRDIFGQGYIYKIIEDSELADVDALTDAEKANGISTDKNYYVPYDKGDKDGNRWYLETPFAIAWSKENVQFFKTDPKARFQGYTFFFREGFCWIDVNSTYLKSRLKGNGVFDVLSMSLFTMSDVPDWYFVSLINSSFISLYVDNFINNTSHFQINDARQLPIIIGNEEVTQFLQHIVCKAIHVKKTNPANSEKAIDMLQVELDEIVKRLYRIDL